MNIFELLNGRKIVKLWSEYNTICTWDEFLTLEYWKVKDSGYTIIFKHEMSHQPDSEDVEYLSTSIFLDVIDPTVNNPPITTLPITIPLPALDPEGFMQRDQSRRADPDENFK
jgi:hypothetical protein